MSTYMIDWKNMSYNSFKILGAFLSLGFIFTGCTKTQKETEGIDYNSHYQAFLESKEKITFHNECDYTEYLNLSEILEDGKDYTFEELNHAIDSNCSIHDLHYSYIDCGLDDDYELLISIETEYIPWDECCLKFVVKHTESGLKLCYVTDEWSRRETNISYSGFVVSDGASGATDHTYYYGYIDKYGAFRLWYEEEELAYIKDDDEPFLIYQYMYDGILNVIPLEGIDSMCIYEFTYGNLIRSEKSYAYIVLYDLNKKKVDINSEDKQKVYLDIKDVLTKEGYMVISEREAQVIKENNKKEIGLENEILLNNCLPREW